MSRASRAALSRCAGEGFGRFRGHISSYRNAGLAQHRHPVAEDLLQLRQ